MKLKLKDELPDDRSATVQLYARALRVIGQDLGQLFPQSLEIMPQGMDFHVTGRYLPRDGGAKSVQGKAPFLSQLRSKLLREQGEATRAESPAQPLSFDRTYTAAEIDRLDETGGNRRNGTDKAPDIYSLGEMLRMLGRIVDGDAGRLVKISKEMQRIRLEYQDRSGCPQIREFSNLELYRLQQQYYAERGTYVPIDNWAGS